MTFFSRVASSGVLGRGQRAANAPEWVTAAGTLSGSPTFHSQRSSKTYTVSATAPSGGSISSYVVTSGSIPSGMALGSANGVVHGVATQQSSNTTFTFTVTATSSFGTTAAREFNFVVNAPVVQSFTATGPASFTVPTGITAVDVLVVAGGGGGGNDRGAGGGGGGLIFRPALPVSPADSIALSVGAGGANDSSSTGGNSTFGPLTAIGGGTAGPSWPVNGRAGGSGAGAGSNNGGTGGPATQPGQPGDSGTYGFGNAGGGAAPHPFTYTACGGGGGAGAAGQAGRVGTLASVPSRTPPAYSTPLGPGPTAALIAGDGGAGRAYDISGSSVFYAGGGGGTNAVDNPSFNTAGYAGSGGQGGGGDGGLAMIPPG